VYITDFLLLVHVPRLFGCVLATFAGKMKPQEKRKSGTKKALAQTCSTKMAETVASTEQSDSNNMLIDNMHDYLESDTEVLKVSFVDDFPPLSITPVKSPAPKLRRVEDSTTDAILSQLSSLSQLINSRSDALEKLVSDNSVVIADVKMAVTENTKQIAGIKDSFDAVCAEVNSVKERVDRCESLIEACKVNTDKAEQRVSQLEAYSRRWNLKLYGLEENDQQDLRHEFIQICLRLLPEAKTKLPDAIDVVHRLGPRKPGNIQPRGVIARFSSRFYRDAVWRSAKNSGFLKTKNLKLAEDLSAEDREKRKKLWPVIDQARKDGKPAFFVGGRAFVGGKEIFPP